MPGLFDTLGLSSGAADARARAGFRARQQAASQQASIYKKGTKRARGDIKEGYGTAREDLAAPLQAAGEYLSGTQIADRIRRGAYGLRGTEGTAEAEGAYRNYLLPGQRLANENIFRTNANTGALRSGNTLTDLANYEFDTRYQPWLQGLQTWDPLKANQQVTDIGTTLGGYATGQGTALGGLATGQANALAGVANQQGQNTAGLYDTLNLNAANVGQNWGSLASGLLGAGTKLFGMYGPQPNTGWNTTSTA